MSKRHESDLNTITLVTMVERAGTWLRYRMETGKSLEGYEYSYEEIESALYQLNLRGYFSIQRVTPDTSPANDRYLV